MADYAYNPFDHLEPLDGPYPTVAMPHPFNRQPVFSTMGRGPRGEQGERGFPGEASRKDFETVADMVAEQSLEAGDICRTLGFHAAGDGGAAWYQVVDDATANGMDVLALDNGLYVVLQVTEAYVTPEMFGAYGDGEHDDTDSIQHMLDNYNCICFLNTYMVSDTIVVSQRSYIDCPGKILASSGFTDFLVSFDMPIGGSVTRHMQRNGSINLKVDGNKTAKGFEVAASFGIDYNLTAIYCTLGFEYASSASAYENRYTLQVDGDSANMNALGVNITTDDEEFPSITVVNYITAVKNKGQNTFGNIHAWIFGGESEAVYPDSVCFEDVTNGHGPHIDYLYSDTYKHAIKITNYGIVVVDSMYVALNTSIFSDPSNITPVLIISNDVSSGVGKMGYLHIGNINSYLDYDSLRMFDNTSLKTRLKIDYANLGTWINSASIQQICFPIDINSDAAVYTNLPAALKNEFSTGQINIKPVGARGTIGYVVRYWGSVYEWYAVNNNPTANNWKRSLSNYGVAKSGSGAPTSVTADFFGQIYLDTDNNKVYVAKTNLTTWIDVT